MTVLEVGAGIGDHSTYYINRGCKLTITESRPENLAVLKSRLPGQNIQSLDMENPAAPGPEKFDVVHCYGLLYHLKNPENALKFLSSVCHGKLIMETCVSFGDTESINCVDEDQKSPTQAFSGTGCRPTRIWLYNTLKQLFDHVYVPRTQPRHEEFPLDWTAGKNPNAALSRAIFIASREEIHNEMLSPSLVARHEPQA